MDSCEKNAGAKIPLLEACCPRHRLAWLVPRLALSADSHSYNPLSVVQLLEHVWVPLGKL